MSDIKDDPKIKLEDSIYLRVQGEAGKFNSIPWEMLKSVGDALQDLIKTLALTQVDEDSPIDINNFNIELAGFFQGSAIPEFKLTPRVQMTTGDFQKQRSAVNKEFSSLMNIANSGDYLAISSKYKSEELTSLVSEKVYNFVSSFGESPVEIVKPGGQGFRGIFKINKFPLSVKDRLVIKPVKQTKPKGEITIGVAKVEVKNNGKRKSNKITELYTNKSAVLSYSPTVITFESREYILYDPLLSKISHEDHAFHIENEMLGIVGSGKTVDDAEFDFAREFDFIYRRYNELHDGQMSSRIKRIKIMINNIVKKANTI